MSAILAIVFGLIAMVGYGLNNAIVQKPVKELGVWRTMFFRNVFLSAILLAVLLFTLPAANFSPEFLLVAAGISLIGYLPLALYYRAVKVGKVGVVAPVGNSLVIYTVIFSILFFGESLTAVQLGAIAAIVIGIFLVSLDFRQLRKSSMFALSSGIPFAIAASLLWGLVYFLLKIPVSVLGPILTAFVLEFGVMVFSGIHVKFSRSSFAVPARKILKYVLLVAVFGAAGTLFFNLGIQTAEVSLVAALTFSNPLVAMLYGKFVYKEKLRAQQYLAIILIVAGIAAISYFQV